MAIEQAVKDVGVPTNRIRYTNQPRYATSGGTRGLVLGEYKDGRLEVLMHPSIPVNQSIATAAHEATHLKFDVASRADLDLFTFIGRNFDQLKADDGVTNYSTAHWKHAEKLLKGQTLSQASIPAQLQASLAVEETLTEMAAMRAGGREVGSALYKQLNKLVDRKYKKALEAGVTPNNARRFSRLARTRLTLTAEEKEVVRGYKNGWAAEVNGALRKGTAAGVKKLTERITALDRVIARAPALTKPVTVFRAAPKIAGLRKGATFADAAFVSTSKKVRVVERFMQPGEAHVFQIQLPKGMQVLNVDAVTTGGLKKEAEYLLPRGTTFRIGRTRRLTVAQFEQEFGKVTRYTRWNNQYITVTDVAIVPKP